MSGGCICTEKLQFSSPGKICKKINGFYLVLRNLDIWGSILSGLLMRVFLSLRNKRLWREK